MNKSKGALLYMVMYVRITARMPEHPGCFASLRLRGRVHIIRQSMAAKRGYDEGACGCCTVILNGEAVPSCMKLTVDCDGAHITTLEGLADPVTGELSDVQQAWFMHVLIYLPVLIKICSEAGEQVVFQETLDLSAVFRQLHV